MIDRRSLLSGGAGLLVASGGAAAAVAAGAAAAGANDAASAAAPGPGPGQAPAPRQRRIDLRIRFMTTRGGRTFERGRETASYDFHDDGLVTYHVSSHSDDPRISRDAVYTLDRQYRPLEAFVRLQVDGRYEGSGWFRFEPGQVGSETFNAARGRESRVTKLDVPARAFVAHPVSTDVMLAAAWEPGGAKRQKLIGAYTSSVDPYGRIGPSLAPSDAWLEHAGRETLQTPGGALETDRYELFTAADATEPLESMWTLAGTCVFVRAQARGQYATVYELVEYRAT
jgi:hypothetical protein